LKGNHPYRQDYLELKNNTGSKTENHFFIKANNKLEKTETDKMLFIEAMENYVYIYTPVRKYLTLVSLKSMEEQLDDLGFLRVQKSYLVSARKHHCFQTRTSNFSNFKG